MNYTFHQLKVYIKIVELKSVTKAGNELFMTQPAVSIQLKKFQDQFELPLTEIIHRRIFITEFGYKIYDIAKRIIDEFDQIKYTTDKFKGLLSGKIKMAAASTGKYILPYYIAEFLNVNNSIDISLDVSNRSSVIKALFNNDIDFAFISLPIEDEIIETEEKLLVENDLYLFAASNQKVNLSTTPLVYREKGSATRKQMEKFLKRKKIKFNKSIELTSNEAVKQMVCAGFGCSIMPILGNKHELESNILKLIPTEGLPIKSKWRIVWLKQKKLSPAAAGFLNFLDENAATINKKCFNPFILEN